METKATKTAAEMLNEYHNAILPMAQVISKNAYTANRVASLAKYVGVCESKFTTESMAYYAAEAIIVLDKKPLSWMAV